jgi:hypothetical protein
LHRLAFVAFVVFVVLVDQVFLHSFVVVAEAYLHLLV